MCSGIKHPNPNVLAGLIIQSATIVVISLFHKLIGQYLLTNGNCDANVNCFSANSYCKMKSIFSEILSGTYPV